MLADIRCEHSHQAQDWPERAIKLWQQINKGYKPQRAEAHGRDYWIESHTYVIITNAGKS